ncbi:MAG: diaminopimelate decarboxylase, partial [Actinomycetota bacterium]|nr:diaminopimelate decarboxylase [Actinomycetota bacterium]
MRAHPAGPRHGDLVTDSGAMVAAPTAEAVDALVDSVWPRHCSRGADGAMTVGGVDVRDIAADHGSPV